jgi:DNA-binding response OmpR family regulator
VARILLIDDTPEIAELLTFALRDHGYDVYATGFTDAVTELVAGTRGRLVLTVPCST